MRLLGRQTAGNVSNLREVARALPAAWKCVLGVFSSLLKCQRWAVGIGRKVISVEKGCDAAFLTRGREPLPSDNNSEIGMPKILRLIVSLSLLTLVAVTARADSLPPDTKHSRLVVLAEQGSARAQTRLGLMFETGEGVPQNYPEAVYWYGRAAEQGDPDAQYLLGNCLNLGLGARIDPVWAYVWFDLSASRTRPGEEREHRARMRNAVADRLNDKVLDVAQSLALAWFPKPERYQRVVRVRPAEPK